MPAATSPLIFQVDERPADAELNALFAAVWPGHQSRDFLPVLSHGLTHVTARHQSTLVQTSLIGFVNLAWDGGVHGFLLDTTVHPAYQRQGIGRELVRRAVEIGRARGLEWIHVDYQTHLHDFYLSCGFHPSTSGVLNLRETL